MNNILQKYAKYNQWANQRMVQMFQNLTDEQVHQEIISSYPSIHKTLLHVWDAETIWLLRLRGQSLLMWPSDQFDGPTEELYESLLHRSQELADFISEKEDAYFEEDCTYKTTKGEPFVEQRGFMVHHCLNHSSYHRGQLITMLRQLEQTDLLATDFIYYVRNFKES